MEDQTRFFVEKQMNEKKRKTEPSKRWGRKALNFMLSVFFFREREQANLYVESLKNQHRDL